VRGEVTDRTVEEAGAGGALLVGQHLGVRQPRVVVHDRVHVVVADDDLLARPRRAHRPAVRFPAATVGDAAELLHVHVHQLAGAFPFVADRGGLGRADPLPGHRVQLGQAGQAGAGDDPRHCSGGHSCPRGKLVTPEPLLRAQRDHFNLPMVRGAVRDPMRTRRPLTQPAHALLSVAVQPPLHTAAGHPHSRGDMRLLPPRTGAFNDQQPAAHGQAGISVGHRGPPVSRDVRHLH